MGRTDVEFNAEGTILRGWLYTPEEAGERVPGGVMAHGLSAGKEMYLDAFAQVFAAARPAGPVFHKRHFAGKEPGMIPAVAADPLGPCVMPTPDSWEWFSKTGETRAPSWRNEVTLRSVEMLMEYEPGAYIKRVAPIPLCLVVAAGDVLTPTELALAAYQRALEPKRLGILLGGH